MSMSFQKYFNAQAKLRYSFLHPGGRRATMRMLGFLPKSSDLPILELGCGMGRSAKLVLENSTCNFVGIEGSPEMLACAQALLADNPRVTLIEHNLLTSPLPVGDNAVSAIYAESVLALLDPGQMFRECLRVLKRGGIIVWNERVWSDRIAKADRTRANRTCLRLLGIPAASENPATATEWVDMAKAIGFEVVTKELIESRSQLGPAEIKDRSLPRVFFSPPTLYTVAMDYYIAKRYRHVWRLMENWLFVARKP